MKYPILREINFLFFSSAQVAKQLGITLDSSRVLCHRYARRGLFIRVKRDLYILKERWQTLSLEEKFRLANLIQVPSYLSLTTALAYWEITTQVPQDFFESVALYRTKEIQISPCLFVYFKLKRNLYFGFKKVSQFFIAEPEKALVDALYLCSLNRYSLDRAALSLKKLNRAKTNKILRSFPEKTKKLMESLWKH